VLNKKTNEHIHLKTWRDSDGELYYYMSASMPSSKLKAGKAYMELEKHIPKGATLLENTSLSYDSFLNILKQTKNPKFETIIKGSIPMNDMSVTNKLKSVGNKTSDGINLQFFNKSSAKNAVDEMNILLEKYNLPKATLSEDWISIRPQAHLPSEPRKLYGIDLPNIGLKKLYSILGITTGTKLLSQQNSNNNKNKLKFNNKY